MVRDHKKTDGSEVLPSIPMEPIEFAQKAELAEETDCCRPTKKSAAEPENAMCWSGVPMCEECRETPSLEITASHVRQSYSTDHSDGPRSLPNGVESFPSHHYPERNLFVDL